MKALVIKQPGEAVTAQDTVALIGCGGVGLSAIAASHFSGASYDRGGPGRCEVGYRQEGRGRLRRRHQQRRPAPQSSRTHRCSRPGCDHRSDRVATNLSCRRRRSCIRWPCGLHRVYQRTGDVRYPALRKKRSGRDGLAQRLPEDFRQVIQMLEQRLFPVEEAATAIVRIEEAPALLRAWTENPSRFSKIMVSME